MFMRWRVFQCNVYDLYLAAISREHIIGLYRVGLPPIRVRVSLAENPKWTPKKGQFGYRPFYPDQRYGKLPLTILFMFNLVVDLTSGRVRKCRQSPDSQSMAQYEQLFANTQLLDTPTIETVRYMRTILSGTNNMSWRKHVWASLEVFNAS